MTDFVQAEIDGPVNGAEQVGQMRDRTKFPLTSIALYRMCMSFRKPRLQMAPALVSSRPLLSLQSGIESILDLLSRVDLFVSFLLGLLGKVFFDIYREPKLTITGFSGPWITSGPVVWLDEKMPAATMAGVHDFRAYRVRVCNPQKLLLNAAARNCTAWLILEGAEEPYELSWIGAQKAITINVGDEREFDLCALQPGYGWIIASTEAPYFPPNSRPRLVIGRDWQTLRGIVRVTAENAKKAEQAIEIRARKNSGRLDIKLAPLGDAMRNKPS